MGVFFMLAGCNGACYTPIITDGKRTARTIMNTKNLLTIGSLTILVGTEILGAALALGWALGSMYELPDLWRTVIIGFFMLAGAYTVWRFVQNALKVEPVFDKK